MKSSPATAKASAPATIVIAEIASRVAGPVQVAATAAGLCATAFGRWGDPLRFAHKLPAGTRPETGRNAHIDRFADELARWDAGALPRFTGAVDLTGVPPFIAAVLAALRSVASGDVVSYGQLAAMAGNPRAARAVGQAMHRNPLPLIIPCHRVIAHGGRIGGFTPGTDAKRVLLKHEGVVLP